MAMALKIPIELILNIPAVRCQSHSFTFLTSTKTDSLSDRRVERTDARSVLRELMLENTVIGPVDRMRLLLRSEPIYDQHGRIIEPTSRQSSVGVG